MKRQRKRKRKDITNFSAGVIPFPEFESEFEIQAELYGLFKQEGILVRGEVRAAVMDFNEKRLCKMDLVIFNRLHQAIAIIECKNRKNENLDVNPKCRQVRRYSGFGLPLFHCLSMRQVQSTFSEVMGFVNDCQFS